MVSFTKALFSCTEAAFEEDFEDELEPEDEDEPEEPDFSWSEDSSAPASSEQAWAEPASDPDWWSESSSSEARVGPASDPDGRSSKASAADPDCLSEPLPEDEQEAAPDSPSDFRLDFSDSLSEESDDMLLPHQHLKRDPIIIFIIMPPW